MNPITGGHLRTYYTESKRLLFQIVWTYNRGLNFHHSEFCTTLVEAMEILNAAILRGIKVNINNMGLKSGI